MYGESANKLAHHAKRTLTLPTLPAYQTDLVRSVTREVRSLDADVAQILEPFGGSFNPNEDAATATRLLVDYMAMRRDKRCLVGYHRVRCEKIEGMVWRGEDVVQPVSGGSGGVGGGSEGAGAGAAVGEGGEGAGAPGSALSPEEEEYARLYAELLAAYKGKWTDIDLTGSLEPPRDLFIDVRVLRDAGEIQTEYGAITLTKNSQFYVRQGDVERLIAQGYLQKLS